MSPSIIFAHSYLHISFHRMFKGPLSRITWPLILATCYKLCLSILLLRCKSKSSSLCACLRLWWHQLRYYAFELRVKGYAFRNRGLKLRFRQFISFNQRCDLSYFGARWFLLLVPLELTHVWRLNVLQSLWTLNPWFIRENSSIAFERIRLKIKDSSRSIMWGWRLINKYFHRAEFFTPLLK